VRLIESDMHLNFLLKLNSKQTSRIRVSVQDIHFGHTREELGASNDAAVSKRLI